MASFVRITYLPSRACQWRRRFFRPVKAGDDGETLHDFARRRFGREFADKVIDPLATGIFMGDARSLSASGAFPKLPKLERKFGSVTRGILQASRGSEPGRRLFSWPDGIATLPQYYAHLLKHNITTGAAVTKITPIRKGFEVRAANSGTLRTRAVVLAVQPHVAAALLEHLEPEAAAAAAQISAPPVGVVYPGYRRAQVSHPLDGLGYLSTHEWNRIKSGTQFCSTMFDGRASRGHVSIACYVGGTRNPEYAENLGGGLADEVHDELTGILGIKGKPVVTRVRHWSRGLQQYTLGHARRRDTIEAASHRLPGVFLCGNYL